MASELSSQLLKKTPIIKTGRKSLILLELMRIKNISFAFTGIILIV